MCLTGVYLKFDLDGDTTKIAINKNFEVMINDTKAWERADRVSACNRSKYLQHGYSNGFRPSIAMDTGNSPVCMGWGFVWGAQ